MKNPKFTCLFVGILACLICLPPAAQAHDTWVTPSTFQSGENELPGLTAFSSHIFPAPEKDTMASERVESLSYVTASGKPIPAGKGTGETGTFVGVVLPVNGFATKTPDGYQRGKNKKQVNTPLVCTKSAKFAKTVFTVGKAGGEAYSAALGHEMEIIPLKDPATLKVGEILPVKVLLKGKPARTMVFGTYDGFSDQANTFGYATRTDKNGVAQIKVIHSGAWLLIAKHEQPYPDLSECDVQRWAASLTFEVK